MLNLNPNISGKKLLLIGGTALAEDMKVICHRNGASLGVTDYDKNTYMKKIADKSYDIDVFDVDALSHLCKEEEYDGVITQYIDRTLPVAAAVAERICSFSPFTTEQIKMSTDKDFFGRVCRKYGVLTPKVYETYTERTGYSGQYPVLVKPVDNSSSRGVCVCKNEQELLTGVQIARRASQSGRIIVEEYLPYDEINVTYIAQDGNIQLAAIHDRYFNESQNGVMKVPDMYIYPSKYTNLYYETVNEKAIRMLKGIGVRNGSLFMQAIVHDGKVYFYEAGMRLNGCKTYEILEYENNYNTLEHLIYYCLTGSMGKQQKFNARFKKWYATWNVVGIPGRICAQYPGLEALNSYPWLINIAKAYPVGTMIRENSAGTLLQLVARIHLVADDKEQLFERIQKMYELFQVIDEKGNSVIMPGHEIDDLRKSIDYELG